jgi:hypothetical protein
MITTCADGVKSGVGTERAMQPQFSRALQLTERPTSTTSAFTRSSYGATGRKEFTNSETAPDNRIVVRKGPSRSEKNSSTAAQEMFLVSDVDTRYSRRVVSALVNAPCRRDLHSPAIILRSNSRIGR